MTTLPAFSFFIATKRKTHLPVYLLNEKSFKTWLAKQTGFVKTQVEQAAFKAKPDQAAVLLGQNGKPSAVVCGVASPIGPYDSASAVAALEKFFKGDALGKVSFSFEAPDKNLSNAYLGWALGCYHFGHYRQKPPMKPALVAKNLGTAKAMAEAIFLLKNLVNEPANTLGPDEIESSARAVAKAHKAKISVVKGKDLLKENFPLIYTVGKASPREPRLIELNWGNAKHPKIALVGKGVAFDTGGLNLKPTAAMALMKKDMGGAAHALALAHLIMSHKLPVNLQLLIPAVENSVSGNAFRPGDVIKSRKGLFVENTNTDAEGRLILADSLTYASERKPEFIVDFATLTGSARAALGPDIPALFSTSDKVADAIRKISFAAQDPLWPMPLWPAYKKHIESAIADLHNSSGTPGDLPFSALFLNQFVDAGATTDWVHIDCYAWEHTGRTGRPRGGADTGLRAMFEYLQSRYK